MVITLKVEDNKGEVAEYTIFPVELTRELVEQHVERLLEEFPDQFPVEAKSEQGRENTINFVLENFKWGHKIIYSDGREPSEELKIFTSVEMTLVVLVAIHKDMNSVE